MCIAGAMLWSFDGTQWEAEPFADPLGLAGRIVHDRARNRLQLWGGYPGLFSYLQEHDGTAWRPAVLQPFGLQHSAATDFARQRVLLLSSGQVFERTRAGWRQLATANALAIGGARLFHDVARQQAVAVGVSGYPNDTIRTFALLGATWQEIVPEHEPPPRIHFAFAYDARRRVAVLHGGQWGNHPPLADTWEFDGVDWKQRVTSVAPPARSQHGMVYDLARAACVVCGGDDGSQTALVDTWLFDETGWRQVLTAHAPTATIGSAMAYEPFRGRVVLHGGWSGSGTSYSGESWEFDGVDWHLLVPSNGVLAERDAAMFFDPALGRLAMTGGIRSGTSAQRPQTHLLEMPPAPLATRLGTGCAGSQRVPMLDVLGTPALGSVVVLQAADLAPAVPFASIALGFGFDRFGGSPLPIALGALGRPHCDLWIAPEPGLEAMVAAVGARAIRTVRTPSSPALAGLVVAGQAFVFDPGALAGFAVSNAVVMTWN